MLHSIRLNIFLLVVAQISLVLAKDWALFVNQVPEEVICVQFENGDTNIQRIQWSETVSALDAGISHWVNATHNGPFPQTFDPWSGFKLGSRCRRDEESDAFKIKEFPIDWNNRGKPGPHRVLFQYYRSLEEFDEPSSPVFAYCGTIVRSGPGGKDYSQCYLPSSTLLEN